MANTRWMRCRDVDRLLVIIKIFLYVIVIFK